MNQPQIIPEYSSPIATGIELNKVLVDVYGQHQDTGYECHCVAIAGTRIDITEMLSDEQIDTLEDVMNNDLPTWEETRIETHQDQMQQMFENRNAA